jgi:hypothetical protein
MNSGLIGVAISTTGEEHRLGFLETCVKQWRAVLPLGSVLIVTVDGTVGEMGRAYGVTDPSKPGNVYRVGQPLYPTYQYHADRMRMGVAVNKNTGLELLMEQGVTHLFLCDDDTWPLNDLAVNKHLWTADAGLPHSMVCWGDSRLMAAHQTYAAWTWPRGVLLYTRRDVIEVVGGMDERFGPGGHEHVEWSRRIHQRGFTPESFVTPLVYAETGVMGKATRAASFWHAEDMRRRGETVADHRLRRRRITSLRRKDRNWEQAERVLAERDGDTSFVPYQAHMNGRASATLCSTSTGLGAGGEA